MLLESIQDSIERGKPVKQWKRYICNPRWLPIKVMNAISNKKQA